MSAFGAFWPQLNNVIKDRMTAIEFSSKNLFINSGPFEREKYFENLNTLDDLKNQVIKVHQRLLGININE